MSDRIIDDMKWPQHCLAEIDRLIDDCQPGAAVALARDAHGKWPEDIRFPLRIASACRSMQRLREAGAWIDSALELQPDNLNALRQRASVANVLSDYPTADRIVERMAAIAPHALQTDIAAAETQKSRGDVLRAIDLATEAGQRHPDSPRPHLLLGEIFHSMGRSRSALKAYRTAAVRDPRNTNALLGVALSAMHLDDQETAAAMVRRALEVEPLGLKCQLAMVGIARQENVSQDDLRAIAMEYAEQLRAAPGKSEAWVNLPLGDLNNALDMPDEALECWSVLDTGDEPNAQRWLQSADCHLKCGRSDEAVALIERYLELNPAEPQALIRLAGIEISMGNIERGIALRYGVIASEYPKHVSVAVRLAADLFVMGRHEEANSLFEHWFPIGRICPEPEFKTVLQRQGRVQDLLDLALHWTDNDDCPTYLRRFILQSLVAQRQFDRARAYAQHWRDIGAEHGETFLEYVENEIADDGRPDFTRNVGMPEERLMMSAEELEAKMRPTTRLATGRWPATALAWSVARDKSMGWAEWRDRAVRATALFQALSRRPFKLKDIRKYIQTPDLSGIEDLLAEDKPFIGVTTHSGPYSHFATSEFVSKAVYMMTGRHSGVTQVPVISFLGDTNAVAIQCVTALRKGYRLFIASDTAASQMAFRPVTSGASATLFGVPITLPNTIPKLAQELKVPTVFFQPYWQGDKIAFDIRRLPDPVPGEDRQAWYDRWAAAYLAQVEQVMSSAPENQNLGAAPWRFLLLNGLLKPETAMQTALEPA
ncbi:hypothetical protein GE300_19080 [Rhodobacteraceae bacterium 2CG4]|uniref:Tetratricopeptide repeat protein n=1 Tax=Halovulum marinum TaxID=2662447 RepID=A0A6L5Z5I1_9RHOB|nr:tetratricopeptide repeat protein [Halovulum marinum]MSU91687.1 hypothetical protein [Halovulum marinum]